jgi:glutamine cyclotransferase
VRSATWIAASALVLASCHAARPPLAAPAPVPVPVRVVGADVVATFPHAPEAFTQGLEIYDGRLYESTGLHGHSSVRIVDLETGRVDRRVSVAAEHYAEGLTIFGGRVYQLTYQSQRCFVYDAETLERVGEHTYPGEGWGLTHDAVSLILSDGTSTLRFLDPETFAEQRTLDVREGDAPVEALNELEMVEGELFANVWMSDRIARIDLTTGQVTGWIDLGFLRAELGLTEPQAVLNGIAYAPESHRLFVTGKLWPTLYEIRVRSE